MYHTANSERDCEVEGGDLTLDLLLRLDLRSLGGGFGTGLSPLKDISSVPSWKSELTSVKLFLTVNIELLLLRVLDGRLQTWLFISWATRLPERLISGKNGVRDSRLSARLCLWLDTSTEESISSWYILRLLVLLPDKLDWILARNWSKYGLLSPPSNLSWAISFHVSALIGPISSSPAGEKKLSMNYFSYK